eukprot:4925613-Prymnesium_polylepis.1
MSGCDAVTVKAGCCVERTQGAPWRPVVLDLRNCAGSARPGAAAKASPTLTRATGISLSALITAGVEAMRRTRLEGTP